PREPCFPFDSHIGSTPHAITAGDLTICMPHTYKYMYGSYDLEKRHGTRSQEQPYPQRPFLPDVAGSGPSALADRILQWRGFRRPPEAESRRVPAPQIRPLTPPPRGVAFYVSSAYFS